MECIRGELTEVEVKVERNSTSPEKRLLLISNVARDEWSRGKEPLILFEEMLNIFRALSWVSLGDTVP